MQYLIRKISVLLFSRVNSFSLAMIVRRPDLDDYIISASLLILRWNKAATLLTGIDAKSCLVTGFN